MTGPVGGSRRGRTAGFGGAGAPTVAPRPSAVTFGGLLRELATRWPDRPAIVFDGATRSFAELDVEVDAWANSLLALGINRGDTVAVLSGNRPEWLIATMAAARVGAVVAPMNTWHQQQEMAYTLEHSRAAVLITAGSLLKQNFTALLTDICPRLSGGRGAGELPNLRHVVGLDEDKPSEALSMAEFLEIGQRITEDRRAAAEDAVTGADPLFVLYTSGSTARPKGVVLHHESTIVNDFDIGERQRLTPNDRAWIVIPLFYAFAAVNAVPAVWSHGGALVLQDHFDAEAALDLIEAERASVYYGLGHMTRSLLAAQARRPRDISSLTKGLTGYSYEDKRLAIEDLGVTGCCGIYGLTESHGLVATSDAQDPVTTRLSSDGRVLPAWEVLIVDPLTETPLPSGEVGHLLIRGPLTSGYLHDPEQTSAVLRSDGFFRTGDLVHIDADGELHFHSRLKELIKTGGINVSPVEVEHLIEEHPAVSLAVVFGVPDPVRGEAVIAVVTTHPGASVTAADLRAYVKARAANFKVPTHIVFRDHESLPRLASNKIARGTLRE
jgi:fatty-acyl-CoA synthase